MSKWSWSASGFGRGKVSSRTRVALVAVCTAWVLAAGCGRPVEVSFSAAGAKDLGLFGEREVNGTLTQTLKYQGKTFEKGTEVRVSQTFLVRKDGGKPPSYHFKGFYDPSKRNDGLVLPEGATDMYFLGLVEPDRRQKVAVPSIYFKRKP